MEKKEPSLKSTAFLRDALVDAEILLSHASEYGITIDPNFIKSIVTAKRNEQTGDWTEQEEIDFWIAFQSLSKAIQPVSIDSLRAASEPKDQKLNKLEKFLGRKKKSMVESSVTWYRSFALIAMVFMLGLQIYSLIGTALLAKYNDGSSRNLEIEKRMESLIIITSSNPEDKSANTEKTNLEQEREMITQEIQTGIQLLDDWLNFTSNIYSRTTHEISRTIQLEQSSSLGNGPADDVANDASLNNIVIVQKAKSLVIVLNQYLLPLLYGFLGGFAFVLRELASETKSMTYTPTSNIKYGLRIHLGALAGLVIGFLWGDLQGKSFGVVESLSPLAVAFLAGYSVDFLFRMLDSVVGSASKKVADTANLNKTEPVQKQ